MMQAIKTIIERAVVAAKREFWWGDTHAEEGAVAGATHEALQQIIPKAIGLNLGGKIGLARRGDHFSVAVFCAVGLLHLNEVAVGLGAPGVEITLTPCPTCLLMPRVNSRKFSLPTIRQEKDFR